MLAGKGSSRSDRLNVLGDQTFHLHCGQFITDSKEIPAYLERFCKVYLVLIFGFALFNLDTCYNRGTEIMQYGTRPYFLNDKMKRKYLRIVDERIKRFIRKSEF